MSTNVHLQQPSSLQLHYVHAAKRLIKIHIILYTVQGIQLAKTPSASFSKTLIGTDKHSFGISIAASINKYLKFPSNPLIFSHDKLPTRYHEDNKAALQQQHHIGWHQLMQGFIALPWLHLASRTPLDNTKQDLKRGNHHMHLTPKALHIFTRSIWLGRNDALHKQADTSTSINYSAKSAELCHYLADPLLLPAEDCHYVSSSLNKLLLSRPSVRRRWLRRVRSSRARMI